MGKSSQDTRKVRGTTIEPAEGFWVKEFSVGAGRDRTYYSEAGGELLLKMPEYAENVGAVVAVTVDLDDGEHHLVEVDTMKLHDELEAMTEAAGAILRVRDRMLKMHGYASIEEYLAVRST